MLVELHGEFLHPKYVNFVELRHVPFTKERHRKVDSKGETCTVISTGWVNSQESNLMDTQKLNLIFTSSVK